jgi:hypothetical protein
LFKAEVVDDFLDENVGAGRFFSALKSFQPLSRRLLSRAMRLRGFLSKPGTRKSQSPLSLQGVTPRKWLSLPYVVVLQLGLRLS